MTTASQEKPSTERQELSLNDAATHVLEECRTVVPGMQALFGFQLIAVFSAGFGEQLSLTERTLHLAAIVLVTIAIVLVMAPAALHRQTEPEAISRQFITISSRLLMASMVPLAVGICLDVYVVARVIVGSHWSRGSSRFSSSVFSSCFGCCCRERSAGARRSVHDLDVAPMILLFHNELVDAVRHGLHPRK